MYVILLYVKMPKAACKNIRYLSTMPRGCNILGLDSLRKSAFFYVYLVTVMYIYSINPGTLCILSKQEKEMGKWNKLVCHSMSVVPKFCSKQVFCSSTGTPRLMEIWVFWAVILVREIIFGFTSNFMILEKCQRANGFGSNCWLLIGMLELVQRAINFRWLKTWPDTNPLFTLVH